MRQIKLCVAYQGTDFKGWQRQREDPTVQQVLEEAAAEALGHPVTVVGAGRTDSGVHALGQIATFRTDSTIPPDRLPFAINRHLPLSVRVTSAEAVSPDFHPCISARGKHYRYTLRCDRIESALWHCLVTTVHDELHWESMAQAAGHMVGHRDFGAFRSRAKGQDEIDPVKEVRQLVLRRFHQWFLVDVLGSGFLYKQVRTMVGTLLEVGRGSVPPDHVATILASGERDRAGPTAPARGLCLMQVFYGPIPPTWFEVPGPVVWEAQWQSWIAGTSPEFS